jgi:hypothetical protein
METKTVSFWKNGELVHEVVIGEETAISRLRRSNGKLAGVQAKEIDPDLNILRIVFYPDCTAAVVDWGTFKNKPTFEEFAVLPGRFVDDWARLVWELCPDWQPRADEETTGAQEAEDEKKL